MTFVESYPILSVLPPLVAIILVIATKKVLPSLGAGVGLAALLQANAHPLSTGKLLWEAFAGIFWDFETGEPNYYYIFILLFLLILGVITSLVMMAGGTYAFAEWAMQRIKTRRGAQFLAAILGMLIFIDDYFNALAVGQVGRPITDRRHVSRAKLAYLIDSTSAPVAVLAPFSSWGASIIGTMTPIVAATGLTVTGAEAFVRAAGMNYYAIGAIVFIWFVVSWGIDFGPMRKEEVRAVREKQPFDPDSAVPGQLTEDLPRHEPGARRALIVPFFLLVFGVIGAMMWTGQQAAKSWAPLDILANTDVSLSLIVGGCVGLAAALYYYLRYTRGNPDFGGKVLAKGAASGAGSMLPAIYILLLAWMLGALIKALGTGDYLGSLVASAHIAPIWLVPLMFVVAAGMAFSTGTSWGSFGILLPLAGEMLAAVPGGEEVLLAAFGAVLAGAVFGDHCSPISDTTILSSTGAACNLTTHVNTQLPYAGAVAGASLLGYIAYAVTVNAWIGLGVTLLAVVGFSVVSRSKWPPLSTEV
ncbi:MAG: Na+/H+ antiporter NhaC family protein [Buchananella hordeovulneris]|nr:Na+/H+ antiporter NhaC family protein [Buchananella hordeovulneris]